MSDGLHKGFFLLAMIPISGSFNRCRRNHSLIPIHTAMRRSTLTYPNLQHRPCEIPAYNRCHISGLAGLINLTKHGESSNMRRPSHSNHHFCGRDQLDSRYHLYRKHQPYRSLHKL